jgi:hypothetical protein
MRSNAVRVLIFVGVLIAVDGGFGDSEGMASELDDPEPLVPTSPASMQSASTEEGDVGEQLSCENDNVRISYDEKGEYDQWSRVDLRRRNATAKSFCTFLGQQSVERALESPVCTGKPLATISFVVHAVGACDKLLSLVQRLLAAQESHRAVVQKILVMEECTDKALVSKLQADVPEVEFHTLKGVPEYAAYNKGMKLVTSEVAFLLRDDDTPGTDHLWVTHFARLFANNPRLGMATCLSTAMGKIQSANHLGFGESPNYIDLQSGDDCCHEIHCGHSPGGFFAHPNKAWPAAAIQTNWEKTHFAYMVPRHCSTMGISKKAWESVRGGFTPYHEPDLRPDWEIEWQFKLWNASYAVGMTDCNPYAKLKPFCYLPPQEFYDFEYSHQDRRGGMYDWEDCQRNGDNPPGCHELHKGGTCQKEDPRLWLASRRYLESRIPFEPSTNTNYATVIPLAGKVEFWAKGPYLCGRNKKDPLRPDDKTCEHYKEFLEWQDFGSGRSKAYEALVRANERLTRKTMYDKHPLPTKPFDYPKCKLPSNTTSKRLDKSSCMIMSYPGGKLNRLNDTLTTLLAPENKYSEILHEIILVWNDAKKGAVPEYLLQKPPNTDLKIRVVNFEVNSLLNRFHPSLAVETAAVVFLDDDDKPLPLELLKVGYATWKCDPLRVTYMSGRGIPQGERPGGLQNYRVSWYAPNGNYGYETNAGVPIGMFMSVDWFCFIWAPELEDLHNFVRDHWCKPDDMTVSFLTQFFSRRAPFVYPATPGSNIHSRRRLMAGSPRWVPWRGEAIKWITKFFLLQDANFTMASRKSEGYRCQYSDSLAKPKWKLSSNKGGDWDRGACKSELEAEDIEWYISQSQQQCRPEGGISAETEVPSVTASAEDQAKKAEEDRATKQAEAEEKAELQKLHEMKANTAKSVPDPGIAEEKVEQASSKTFSQKLRDLDNLYGAVVPNKPLAIHDWLLSVNVHLEIYATGLGEYGYEDTTLLGLATKEDIEEVMTHIKMKRPHRRVFIKALQELHKGSLLPA